MINLNVFGLLTAAVNTTSENDNFSRSKKKKQFFRPLPWTTTNFEGKSDDDIDG